MMSVVDINMRNLARWVDGVYDLNLLAGSSAVSTNIEGSNGYIVYFRSTWRQSEIGARRFWRNALNS